MEPKYLSYSQIRSYLDCARRYRFERSDTVEPSHTNSVLVLGSAVHAAAGWWQKRELIDGRDVREDEVVSLLSETLFALAKNSRQVRYNNGHDLDSMISQGKALVSCLYKAVDREETVLAIEKEVTFRLPCPDGDEDNLPPITCVLDKIIRREGENGGYPIGTDLKTSSRTGMSNYTDTAILSQNLQSTIYCLALRILYANEGRQQFRFDVVTKPTKTIPPEMASFITTRDNDDYSRLTEIVRHVLRGIRAGSFPPANPGWICKTCPYAYCCR